MSVMILDARDVGTMKGMHEAVNARAIGAHQCAEVILCSREFATLVMKYYKENPTAGFFNTEWPTFMGLPLRMNLPSITEEKKS